jgi:predicted ester cyclase
MASTPSPIRRIFDEAYNVGNLEVVDKALTPDHYTHITIGGAPNRPRRLKMIIAMFRTAFPDLWCIVEDEITVGDKFAARWALRGTPKGMILGNPPTGKQVDVPELVFGRTENECIIEDWILIDQLGIQEQHGIVPPSGRHERKSI